MDIQKNLKGILTGWFVVLTENGELVFHDYRNKIIWKFRTNGFDSHSETLYGNMVTESQKNMMNLIFALVNNLELNKKYSLDEQSLYKLAWWPCWCKRARGQFTIDYAISYSTKPINVPHDMAKNWAFEKMLKLAEGLGLQRKNYGIRKE